MPTSDPFFFRATVRLILAVIFITAASAQHAESQALQLPLVQAGANQTITSASASLKGTASDPNGLTFITLWMKSSGPGTVTFVNATSLTATANFTVSGTYVLTLKAKDSAGLIGSSNVTITVNLDPHPVVRAGANQTITLPAPATLSGSATDPNGLPLTLQWSERSGPGTVTFATPNAPTTTAIFSAAGSYVVTLRATNSSGYTDSSSATITVNPAQQSTQPPIVNAGGNQTITSSSAALSGSASDPNGLALTVLWSKASGPGTVTFANANAVNTTANFSAAGSYVLTLKATNTAGLSGSSSVTITVNPAQQQPIVSAGASQTITLPASASLSGSASDPNGLALTVLWSQASGPGTVTFVNPNAVSTTANFSAAGSYVLALKATDSAGLSSTANVSIAVNPANGGNSNLVVDAGPTKVIALPVKDVSLFGHATGGNTTSLTIQWSQTSGPVQASLSAPWALATTATFSSIGVYGFQLLVSDGSSTVTSNTTVIVNLATAQTAFYVDPTFMGSSSDGSSGRPWKTLALSPGDAAWTAINSALASNDVIVYFSARQAGSDTPEVEHNEVNLWRTDRSSHRLTLDGMSKYNASDATPSWLDYAGAQKFNINITSGSISIGVQSNQTSYPANYVTIRGFNVSGSSGRVAWAGSYSVVEYVDSHDDTSVDPTFLFHSAVNANCTPVFGNLHDITLRGNTLTRGFGEGIYINGNYILASEGGCMTWGNTHSDILIENNKITDPGYNGRQGDGIDLKAGLTNVTIRGNTIQNTDNGSRAYSQGARCIVSSGVPDTSTQGNYLIEYNVALKCPGFSIQQNNNVTIRNNVMANLISSGVATGITTDSNTSYRNKNINIFDNTIYYGVITLMYQDGAMLRNNLISGLTNQEQLAAHGSSTNISSDDNSLVSGATLTNWTEGGRSIYLSGSAPLFVNVGGFDFHLLSGVAPINAGIPLTPAFPNLDGASRPQSSAWNIGAY
jgi:hypothetical protein